MHNYRNKQNYTHCMQSLEALDNQFR